MKQKLILVQTKGKRFAVFKNSDIFVITTLLFRVDKITENALCIVQTAMQAQKRK